MLQHSVNNRTLMHQQTVTLHNERDFLIKEPCLDTHTTRFTYNGIDRMTTAGRPVCANKPSLRTGRDDPALSTASPPGVCSACAMAPSSRADLAFLEDQLSNAAQCRTDRRTQQIHPPRKTPKRCRSVVTPTVALTRNNLVTGVQNHPL